MRTDEVSYRRSEAHVMPIIALLTVVVLSICIANIGECVEAIARERSR
jgi:hypothetical protein